MQHEIQVGNVSIRSDKDGRFCLNDLHKAAGGEKKHRPQYWLQVEQTKALIDEIIATPGIPGVHESKAGIPALDKKQPVNVIHGGVGRGTYACKELVYSYAMWISSSFHLKVIRVFDAVVTGKQQPQAIPNDCVLIEKDELLWLRGEVIERMKNQLRAERYWKERYKAKAEEMEKPKAAEKTVKKTEASPELDSPFYSDNPFDY